MNEDDIKDIMEAVTELRKEVEKKSVDKDKVERINAALDSFEEKNQQAVKEFQRLKDLEEKTAERIKTLEALVARGGQGGAVSFKDTAEYKALEQYVKTGEINPEQKTLRTDIDTQGGYLVSNEVDAEITRRIEEVSDIRSIARVRRTGARTFDMPVRNGIPTATYEGEAQAGSDSESNYTLESVTPFRLTFTTPVTRDQLMNANYDMESEMFQDAAEAFAVAEGNKFVAGSGAKEPEGFLVNADLVANARVSGSSGTITGDDLILLTGDLKVGYQPVYVMHRQTLAFIRTLKDANGMYLWQPGLNGPVMATLNGFPYVLASAMPTIASNSLSVAFGDFRRGYTVIDRSSTVVVRDEFTRKKEGIVEFTWMRWNTGQVTLPEAIKLLKTAP